MNAVDNSVREFSIAFYPPTIFSTIFFCVALAVTLAAGVWLGMRLYLYWHGEMTQGTVTRSLVETSHVKNSSSFSSTWFYTRTLTIEFTAPDGVKRTVKGIHTTNDESKNIPRVGGKIPVLYSRTNPGNAIYYDPLWIYIVPAASLALGFFLIFMAAGFCYRDIRVMNSLSVSNWTEGQYDGYQHVIIECDDAIHHNPENAAVYERRGDAQFAIVQFRDAIADYSEALRLRPDRRELLLKRAKAEWLDGRDYDALRDWLKSR